jgi:flagellar motor switch protein FliN/FliY
MSADLKETVIARSFQDESLMGVKVALSVVLGRSTLRIYQMLKLGRGAVIELEQHTNDPVEILANDIPIAKGEVIVTNDGKIGVTLTELLMSRNNQDNEDERVLLKKELMLEREAEKAAKSEENVTEDMHDE